VPVLKFQYFQMDASDELNEIVTERRLVRLIEDDIYSVLPDTSVPHHYDKRAAVYDLVVSTWLYNFIMWGTSPYDYVEFAHQAVNSSDNRMFLDAGCGSLLFTARIYASASCPIIAVDQSLAMLRRARRRLIDISGSVPERIRLLQADLSDLPFRRETFRTVLCLNVLHQFADAAKLISNLNCLITGGGHFYLTSLVSNSRMVGNLYLSALYRTGEFIRPRNKRELKKLLDITFNEKINYREKGNMAFATATVSD